MTGPRSPGTGPPAPLAPAEAPATTGEALALLDADPTEMVDGLAVTRVGRQGDVPTLLLVHGVGSSRSVWAPVLPQLAAAHHVVVVDLPGHGRSDPLRPQDGAHCAAIARHLSRACIEMGIAGTGRWPHVVGNSLGGWIALEMAADGAASCVVALAPAGLRQRPLPPGPLLRSNRALARRTEPMAAALMRFGAVRMLTLGTVSAAPGAVPVELARSAAANLARCTAYERLLDAATHRRFERARQVRVPTTVVFGDRDLILPGGAQDPGLAPAQAHWVRLPRCGHTPMWDAPRATVEVVRHTVARARPGRPTRLATD